ncbi:MAG: dTMP kinase [Bacillota bacterium]
MKGKLMIIEGSDGSGKATQTEKLYDRLREDGYNIRKVAYPNYNSDSSALVKMYLNGDFGKNPGDVDPYIASTFYAVDRYASFKKEWESFYNSGGIIIADRYTTSNMVHQAAKMTDEEERDKFLNWLWALEFEMYGLPVPDCVIFLDMPPRYSKELRKMRNNKITGEQEQDIHEKDEAYLENSYKNAREVACKYSWESIQCVKEENLKSIEEIHEEIYEVVKKKCLNLDGDA